MAEADALYIVDGSNFLFRAYHALPPLSTRGGVPSGAVYGFTQMLIKLEVDHRPSHLAVVFDGAAHTFRNDLFADYKATRKEPPDDLKPQFGLVRRVVEAFGLPVLDATLVEADDLIATLAHQAHDRSLRVVVVSSDKDLMQLVDEHTTLVDTMKDFVYGATEVEEKWGVPPKQLGDVLALMGDAIDNVPGIPGVGPKTASALIRHFGSLEQLFARMDEIHATPGLRGAASVEAKVKANVEAVKLSRRLVALQSDVVVDVDLEKLRRVPPDMARIEAICRELEFTRLIDRLRPATAKAAAPKPAAITDAGTRFGAVSPRIIATLDELGALVDAFAAAPALAFSLQATAAPTPNAAAPVGIGLAATGLPPAYVPFGHRYLGAPPQLPVDAALARMQPLFAATPAKHVHNLKDALVILGRHGTRVDGVACDLLIASYLIDPNEPHDLASIAKSRVAQTIEDRAALCGTGKKATPIESLEVARAGAFAACEAEAALTLGPLLRAELTARELDKLHDELELPLSQVLGVIERHGVCLDVPILRRLSVEVDVKLKALEQEVHTLTGSEVNLGSPKQLQDLLFGKLGLPAQRKTKTGLSVDADVLEELAPLHPAAALILEHRTLAKLKGTYLDALPLAVDARSGRLHTSYEQAIAATGRLSSVNPNLQNVPVRSQLGKEIRRAFRADAGCLLVVGDYSQIELRVLAHLSGDPVLLDAFNRDEDIHERTVVEMFGSEKRDDRPLRSVAKMINYGIAYGLSGFGLAQRLGIDKGVATRYIENYLKTYAGVARYMDGLIAEAYREGGSKTLLGRFRPLPELQSRNRNIRNYGERMARNTPIQGAAADILKLAMIAVERALEKEQPTARMLLTVHDELVLEAPEASAPAVGELLRAAMEGVMKLAVPLKVDLGIGHTWADAK
jgi:DNA polymerase-1